MDKYITSIEVIECDEKIPVYCFQVDDYHNFVLDSGIVSSNSQMEVRSLAAAANEDNLRKAFDEGLDIHRFFACLTGDTRLRLLNNESISFKELVDTNTKEIDLVSIDENGNTVIATGINPSVTDYRDTFIEITLSNDKKIMCTPEHLIMLKDGTYKMAKELTLSDELMGDTSNG